MKRRRHNDPLGVSENRKVVTDPDRKAKMLAEFHRKLEYLDGWYHFQVKCGLDKQNYNESLTRLKKAFKPSRKVRAPERYLNPQLEMEINLEARKLAALKLNENLTLQHQSFVDQAARHIAKNGRSMRGKPGLLALRQVVEGLMAIYLESTGMPLMAKRDKDSVYDPQIPGSGGRMVRAIVDHLEPNVSDATLSYWMRDIRRKYAGKPMRFIDIFPGYAVRIDPTTGMPVAIPPYRIEAFIPIMPIKCP